MPHIRISELRLDSTVVVATGNPHKVTEIEEILGPRMPGVRFVALGELGDFPEPVEDGSSFFDNAMIKARDALDETGLLVAVADDSGLCVDSLGGAPGIFSARFAGEPCDDAANTAAATSSAATATARARSATSCRATAALATTRSSGRRIRRARPWRSSRWTRKTRSRTAAARSTTSPISCRGASLHGGTLLPDFRE